MRLPFGVRCNNLAGVIGSIDDLFPVDELAVVVVVVAAAVVSDVDNVAIPTVEDAVTFFITLPNNDGLFGASAETFKSTSSSFSFSIIGKSCCD